ncbi:DNA-directed RNA polymerase subunit beta [Desertibacillus haloalkaliphilus]|uniref:DNA-directed RNA polymerase subunit beta n=1 Tax=Desertibacillus haloalkaliphilus TaxID=1328930 RepID=UPI001C27846C|nr:DNA-directed RNA polymerase subunit beta [Desertibacillus haloalkaliphilus]MBU8905921.1 DNA-directed RNA polymerase subunit beta [Desertibacillus haloalkaliphilus]
MSDQIEKQGTTIEEEPSGQTRSERRKERQKRKKNSERTRAGARVRLVPIWLRLIIVVVLVFISLIAGLLFGYGVIGDGSALDALKPETWIYILDMINGEVQ